MEPITIEEIIALEDKLKDTLAAFDAVYATGRPAADLRTVAKAIVVGNMIADEFIPQMSKIDRALVAKATQGLMIRTANHLEPGSGSS